MKIYNAILLLIINYTSCAVFTKYEQTKCRNIVSTKKEDCLTQIFDSLKCCYFEMTQPQKGNICLPLPISSSENMLIMNQTLFDEKFRFDGYLYCGSFYHSVVRYIIILIILII
jgi:hypothetical protein